MDSIPEEYTFPSVNLTMKKESPDELMHPLLSSQALISDSSQDIKSPFTDSSQDIKSPFNDSSQDKLYIAESSDLSHSSQDTRYCVAYPSPLIHSSQSAGSYNQNSSQIPPITSFTTSIRSCFTDSSQLGQLRRDIESYVSSDLSHERLIRRETDDDDEEDDEDEDEDEDEEDNKVEEEKYYHKRFRKNKTLDAMDDALQLNETVRKFIIDEIGKTENMLKKNLGIQSRARKTTLDCRGHRRSSKPITQVRAISVFAAPYFRDLKRMMPPPNEDTPVKKRNNHVNSYLTTPRPWTLAEQKKLMNSITGYALTAALEPFKRDKDFIKRKMKEKDVTEEMLEALEQELFIVEGKIKLTEHRHLRELLTELEKIDWMTVSATSMEGIRTPEECEAMWNNVLSFQLNRGPFTPEEDERLIELAEEFKGKNWDAVASLLKTKRSAIQCYERYQTKLSLSHKKKYWTDEEDERLLELIEEHRCGEVIPWNKISLLMEGRTRQQLINRYERSLSQKNNRAPWTPEEDGILIALVQKYGNHWNKMGSFFKRRSTYAIRERYCNALTPNIRVGPWSLEEDKLLISMIRKYGYGRWAKICQHIPGRTDNMCLIRAGRLLDWSIIYHSQQNTGEFDLTENTPEMYAKMLRPCAPSKYCPIRNERVRVYRENGLKMLLKALEKVAPDYRATIHDLNSIDLKWMSGEMLRKLSNVLHDEFGSRPLKERNPIRPLKYVTRPCVMRKEGEPVPEFEEETYYNPLLPDKEIPRDEKDLVDFALFYLFDVESDIMSNPIQKQINFGLRQCAEMALYKAYLYKHSFCKALCDPEDDLENVTFSKVDYRETMQTVVTYFMQPPVYDNQVTVLQPNLTTLLGLEVAESTVTGLQSMSGSISQSKAYTDYLCERRQTCPKCLQCSLKSGEIASSATPESVIEDIKSKKSFMPIKRLKDAAYIEGGSIERLSTSCTCQALVDSKKSVQLLRKRFLSLFVWPAFVSSCEFTKDHEQLITSGKALDNDYFFDMESKENHRRRKRRTVSERNILRERKPKKAKNVDESEFKLEQKKSKSKQNPHRRKVPQPVVRKSSRSSVLNRSSFVPLECKSKKARLENIALQESEVISDNLLPSGDKNNSPQLLEGKKRTQKGRKVTSKTKKDLPESEMISDMLPQSADGDNSMQLIGEKKKKRKARKVVSKISQELVESEMISDILLHSADGDSSLHLIEKKKKKQKGRKVTSKANKELSESEMSSDILPQSADGDNSLQSIEKKKKWKGRKVASKNSQELVESEIISDILPHSADGDSSLHLIEEKKKKQRGLKVTSKTSQELPESEMSSHILPQSADGDSSLQLIEEKKKKQRGRKVTQETNLSKSQDEKKTKRKRHKVTPETNQELPESEIISDSLPPSVNKNNPAHGVVEEKKKKPKNYIATPKTSQELPLTEMTPDILPPSTDRISTSSQLPEENVAIIMPKKRKYLSRKAVDKTKHERLVPIMILDDLLPSADEVNNLSQLQNGEENDAGFLPVKQNKRKRQPFPITNHELSVSDAIPDNDLSSAIENDSLQLEEEIKYPSKKRNKYNCLKPTLQNRHKPPISVMILDDLVPPVDKNNSISNEHRSNKSITPKKRNKRKICEIFSKTSHESSASEMASSGYNNKSSLLEKLLLEKQIQQKICGSSPKANHESLLHKNTSDDMLLLGDRNNLPHIPEENRCITPSLPQKRNKRKSRIPVQKTRHLLPASEVVLDDTSFTNERTDESLRLLNNIKKEPLVLIEKLNFDASVFQSKEDGAIFLLEKDGKSAPFLKNGNEESKIMVKTENNLSTSQEGNSNSILLPPKIVNGSLVKGDEIKNESNVSSSKDNNKNMLLQELNGNNSLVKRNRESEIDTSSLSDASKSSVLPLFKQKNSDSPEFLKINSNVTLLKDGDDTAILLDEFSISSESSDSCDPVADYESIVGDLAVNSEVELVEMDIQF